MGTIFRQLFDKNSSTYTYILGDLRSKVAILIDTVLECAERDLSLVHDFNFEYVYLMNTHIHADHVTGNAVLKEKLLKSSTIISKYYGNTARADKYVGEMDVFQVGCSQLQFLHTPGHTVGCLSIVDHANKRVFTGDTLLIRGCGRTDFQGGSSEQLYDSIHEKLFKLPRDYTVYPAHDYRGISASSIGEEIDLNPRLIKTKGEFVEFMANLNLAYPKMIDVAVPRNLNCGY